MKNTCNINCQNGHCNGSVTASYDINQLEIQIHVDASWTDVKLNVTGTNGVNHIIEPRMMISNTYYFDIPFDYYKDAGTMSLFAFGMMHEGVSADIVDDGSGNVSITSSAISVSDDGVGNVTIISDYIIDDDAGNVVFDLKALVPVESSPYQFIVTETLRENNIVDYVDGVYYIKNISSAATYIILVSPSGIEYKVMVNDDGTLYTERKGDDE